MLFGRAGQLPTVTPFSCQAYVKGGTPPLALALRMALAWVPRHTAYAITRFAIEAQYLNGVITTFTAAESMVLLAKSVTRAQ
jgi:hypothetical protein